MLAVECGIRGNENRDKSKCCRISIRCAPLLIAASNSCADHTIVRGAKDCSNALPVISLKVPLLPCIHLVVPEAEVYQEFSLARAAPALPALSLLFREIQREDDVPLKGWGTRT